VRASDGLEPALLVSASGGESLEILPWPWDTKVELDPHERAIILVRGCHMVMRYMPSGREITLDRSLDFPRWSPDGQTIVATEPCMNPSIHGMSFAARS
jgi:hypothetical protein